MNPADSRDELRAVLRFLYHDVSVDLAEALLAGERPADSDIGDADWDAARERFASLAATPAPTASLDAAWKAAEAALPEGATFEIGQHVNQPPERAYWANCIRPDAAGSGTGHGFDPIVYGDTPAAALLALAARLAEGTGTDQ